VYALAVSGGTLYAGGDFTMAGGRVSDYMAEAVLSNAPYFATSDGSFGFHTNQFVLPLFGPAGSNVVISVSTNLQDWLPLATNSMGIGTLLFTDTHATNYDKRFYRANLQ
jgi:hypothetical protein